MITEDMMLGFVFGVLAIGFVLFIVTMKGWMKRCNEDDEELYEDEKSDCTINAVKENRYYIPKCPAPLKCDFGRNEEQRNPYINGTVRAMAWKERN